MRRPLLVAVTIGGAVLAVVAAVVAFAFVADEAASDQLAKEKECCWQSGATPRWMSEQIGIRIPATASDRRAGYKIGSRFDTGLLAFTLPEEKADDYLSRLIPEDQDMVENLHPKEKGYTPMAPFGHLGLPEPETLVKGARKIGFCPDGLTSPEGEHLHYCVDLFVHAHTPGSKRIYVRSVFEPGLTPPPAAAPGK